MRGWREDQSRSGNNMHPSTLLMGVFQQIGYIGEWRQITPQKGDVHVILVANQRFGKGMQISHQTRKHTIVEYCWEIAACEGMHHAIDSLL